MLQKCKWQLRVIIQFVHFLSLDNLDSEVEWVTSSKVERELIKDSRVELCFCNDDEEAV